MRDFNRFYTRQIGLLHDGLLKTPFSLTEARVLYELAQPGTRTATDVCAALELDQGYLSRILRDFSSRGLVTKRALSSDRRQHCLSLTAKGRLAFGSLDRRSHQDIGAALARLPDTDQARIVAAMGTLKTLMQTPRDAAAGIHIRPHGPGDMGFVVQSHGTLYAHDYGWTVAFEALVVEIVAQFIKTFDPAREHCWIADLDGEPAGSVFLVDGGGDVARLRLLLVEPRARKLGIARRLTEDCIGFARARGYRKVTLWTQSILVEARALYQSQGFVKVAEAPHAGWGKPLIGETWELRL